MIESKARHAFLNALDRSKITWQWPNTVTIVMPRLEMSKVLNALDVPKARKNKTTMDRIRHWKDRI